MTINHLSTAVRFADQVGLRQLDDKTIERYPNIVQGWIECVAAVDTARELMSANNFDVASSQAYNDAVSWCNHYANC